MNTAEGLEEWDIEIKPKNKLFDLQFKEVWHYRDLMWLFVKRDFIAQFKQTILGPLWHLVQPILTTIMFLLVFGKIAKIPTDGIAPAAFYMSGLTIWGYFASCFTGTSSTFTSNAGIFGKVYFPRIVTPISIILSNLVKFAIQFILLIAILLYYHFNGYPIQISLNLLFLPAILIIIAGISLGLGIIFSSLTTKYRDFTVLLGFAIQLLMYATPVIYPLSYLKGKSYKWIIDLNPLSSLVEAYRYCIFGKGLVEPYSLFYSVVFMLVSVSLGYVIFNRVEKTFMDTV
ncbi:ABC transporter permease [Pedobacter psychrophilus]|uniref:Transport permease protein n=1 Tax=Pedobacter psychrophilus TaxID=1826909 RepID=A0A179DDR1_9SPHI|nr:ABC transporter permease [Pedobacter psychrophilus]OAQ38613.1 ABC transporter permease [Pedobacter psychrophilus]